MRNPHGLADRAGSIDQTNDRDPHSKSAPEYQRLPGRLSLRFDGPGPILARHYLRPADMEALS